MSTTIEPEAQTAPKEVLRYFSTAGRCLISVRADGSTMKRQVDEDWKPTRGINAHPDKTVAEYIAHMREKASQLPHWAQEVGELPSMEELGEWVTDSICPTVNYEDDVEPDGYGPGNVPSWLIALGLI